MLDACAGQLLQPLLQPPDATAVAHAAGFTTLWRSRSVQLQAVSCLRARHGPAHANLYTLAF